MAEVPMPQSFSKEMERLKAFMRSNDRTGQRP